MKRNLTNRRRAARALLAALLCVGPSVLAAIAQDSNPRRSDAAPRDRSSRAASIDDELLRDVPPPKSKTPDSSPPRGKPGTGESPAKTKTLAESNSTGAKPMAGEEGEDIQLVGPEEFLRDIRRRMKQVEQRLRSQDASRSTQGEQEQIAAELESFISQLQRTSNGERKEKSKDGGSGVGSDQTGGTQQATKGKAVESSERNGESERPGDVPGGAGVDSGAIWGSLPPQLRQQIQNLSSDRFLPQYERLIQQYYRRLAESK